MKLKPIFSLPLLLSAPLWAQPIPGLPDQSAIDAIETHPRAQAADARVEAARQDARALRSGSHELSVSGDYTRRSVQTEGNFNEYAVTLSRPIRLPGKAGLDRKAGDLGVKAAGLQAEDTRHKLALLLNELWWDWLAAEAEVRVLAETYATLEHAYRGVASQVRLQDAAQVDADRAMAELSANKAELDAARGRAGIARERLAAQFPGLVLPAEAPELSEPGLPTGELGRLHGRVMTCDHELPAAMAHAERLAVLSESRRRDRLPDPTVGARIFSERGGMERGIGVVVTVPIGGTNRAALSDRAAAEARVSAYDAASVRLDVKETADTDLAQAIATFQTWQTSQSAFASSARAAGRLRAGYRLGHVDLADLLYAERQAKAAALSETQTRAAALRAQAKLRIDAHDLWLDCGHGSEQ